MKSIFFDLETTDLNFVGQILNYSFVVVDDNWKVVDTLSDKIKITRTQLPSPYAILANRVDVIQHQEATNDTEPLAMAKIKDWLTNVVEKSRDKVRLIGYNSSKFDIPYLRTSMIRNGISPYHPNLVIGDLLHIAQKLASFNDVFKIGLRPSLSLKLEAVCKSENILEGSQSHDSLDDVMLTIRLAKHLAEKYGIDVRTYNVYEALKHEKKNDVIIKVSPEKDEEYHKDSYHNYKPKARMVLLDSNKSYSLWIDIDDWKNGKSKDAISWYAKGYSPFFVVGVDTSEDAKALALEAKDDLSHINLDNFFPERNCDIEQFIYMMKFDEMDALYDAIWKKDLSYLKQLGGKYSSQLYLRHLMNYGEPSDKIDELISKYAKYRYGGKMKTNKMDTISIYQEGVENPSFHIKYSKLANILFDLIEQKTGEDKDLLLSLAEFYNSSPITKLKW